MNLRLPVLVLLILSIPGFTLEQSLGDVAREARAEKSKSGAPKAKVITNEDIVEAAPALGKDTTSSALPGTAPAKEVGADITKSPVSENAASGANERPQKDTAKVPETREHETQRRTAEINNRYLDRIAVLRDQINTAQLLLAKLQAQQIDSTNEFKRTAAMTPPIGEYEAQQRSFHEQIETQRSLIVSLNSQLEDAKEAARHAGVPHAAD